MLVAPCAAANPDRWRPPCLLSQKESRELEHRRGNHGKMMTGCLHMVQANEESQHSELGEGMLGRTFSQIVKGRVPARLVAGTLMSQWPMQVDWENHLWKALSLAGVEPGSLKSPSTYKCRYPHVAAAEYFLTVSIAVLWSGRSSGLDCHTAKAHVPSF